MTKDLIIGAFDGYAWDQVKFWANSIDMCGFTGDKIVIIFNSDKATADEFIKRKFVVVGFGRDDAGNFTYKRQHNIPIHVERFFYIWDTLEKIPEKKRPRFVVATDVRDVVFQRNPVGFLESSRGVNYSYSRLIAASESLKYKDEPWGNENLAQTFGSYIHEIYKENEIFNVGVLAGTYEAIKSLCLMIFQMGQNRPIPIVDQAVYNFLLRQEPYQATTNFLGMNAGWAVQLGTVMNPAKMGTFGPKLLEPAPQIDRKDGKVKTSRGEEFYVVHQYDRVPGLREAIVKKYG